MHISKDSILEEIPSVDRLKNKILSFRARCKLQDEWLVNRLDTVLPAVMKRSEIDCWVVCNKEYNEDPVFASLSPASMMTARRLTILLFHLKKDGTLERFALTHPIPDIGRFYAPLWTNPKGQAWGKLDVTPAYPAEEPETQLECLARVLKEMNPEKIGLDLSSTFAYADGLSHTLYTEILNVLDEESKAKIVSAENVAIGWLETRSEAELAAYNGIIDIAHSLIAEAFSNHVILPGVTTNDDVRFWMMQKVIDLGLQPWFDYECSIIRGKEGEIDGEAVILPGDLLHCDVGFRYLGLCTDTQENTYILKPGEDDVPEDLRHAMETVNRLQDITLSCFEVGKTGNEILAEALAKAKEEGITACIYSHPLGFHGHAAGPTIGLWDKQGGVPGSGDYPMYDNTCYSLELNCTVNAPEFTGGKLRLGAETDVMVKDGKAYYMAGRQTSFHLVR